MDIQDALSEIRKTLGEGVDPVLDWLQQEAGHYRLCCDPVSSENNLVTMYLRKSCASALTVLGGWCRLLDGKTLSFGGIGWITLPAEWQLLHYRIVEYYGDKTGLIVPLDALSAWLNDPEDRSLHQRDFFLLREAYHALIHSGISPIIWRPIFPSKPRQHRNHPHPPSRQKRLHIRLLDDGDARRSRLRRPTRSKWRSFPDGAQ